MSLIRVSSPPDGCSEPMATGGCGECRRQQDIIRFKKAAHLARGDLQVTRSIGIVHGAQGFAATGPCYTCRLQSLRGQPCSSTTWLPTRCRRAFPPPISSRRQSRRLRRQSEERLRITSCPSCCSKRTVASSPFLQSSCTVLPKERMLCERDAQTARLRGHFLQERTSLRRGNIGCTHIRPCDGIQHRRAVAHRASEHMLQREAMPYFAHIRPGRRAATAGLESEHSTTRSGNANRTAAIAAAGQRHEARGHRRRRTATGAARRAAQIPRIVGHAQRFRLGVRHEAEFRAYWSCRG